MLLGVIFVCASLDKLAHPSAFAQTLANYRLLPEVSVTLAALTIPWLELVAGLAIVVGFQSDGAALILALLSAGLAAAVASALLRGLNVHCGCFAAAGDQVVSWTGMALDLVLLALALYSLRHGPGRFALDQRLFRSRGAHR